MSDEGGLGIDPTHMAESIGGSGGEKFGLEELCQTLERIDGRELDALRDHNRGEWDKLQETMWLLATNDEASFATRIKTPEHEGRTSDYMAEALHNLALQVKTVMDSVERNGLGGQEKGGESKIA